jgi:hypothetical protein
VKTEVYKVLDNRCMPICSQAGRAAARAGKGGAGDRATGSPVPAAVLSQYNTSDNDTDDEGANNNGINNETANNEGLGNGPTKEEAVKWGADARIDGAAYSIPMEGGTYDDGINEEVAKLDSLYDNHHKGLANKESGERGAGDGAAHAGPKDKVEAAQANATVGRAEVNKATCGKVDKHGLSGNGGNILHYGRDGLEAGNNGLCYGMAGFKAAMAMSGLFWNSTGDEGAAGTVAVATLAKKKQGKRPQEASRPSRSPTNLGQPGVRTPRE